VLSIDASAILAMNQQEIVEFYNKWYVDHQWQAGDAKMICQTAIDLYKQETGNPPESVMDMGCGCGRYSYIFAALLPNADILGVDISQTAIDLAAKNYKLPNLAFACRDSSKETGVGLGDLIFIKGCSIFNKKHFTDEESKSFLPHIAHNCRPGGVVMVIERSDFSGGIYPGSGWYCRSQAEIDSLFLTDYEPEYRSARMVKINDRRISGLIDYAIVYRRSS